MPYFNPDKDFVLSLKTISRVYDRVFDVFTEHADCSVLAISQEGQMIFGTHVVVYTKMAEADRVFFRDLLGFKSVDAGHGWLIFALPPTEAAFHPSKDDLHDSSVDPSGRNSPMQRSSPIRLFR
jgi:hypothetical protein